MLAQEFELQLRKKLKVEKTLVVCDIWVLVITFQFTFLRTFLKKITNNILINIKLLRIRKSIKSLVLWKRIEKYKITTLYNVFEPANWLF